MGNRWRRYGWGLLLLALLAAGAWTVLRVSQSSRQGSRDSTPPAQNQAAPSKPADQSAVTTTKPNPIQSRWTRWGGALNSAEFGGKAFHDRAVAREFNGSVDQKLKAYVIELCSRSLLPEGAGADAAYAEDIFPGFALQKLNGGGPVRTAYLQFLNHPNDAQRAQLKTAGIELLAYMSGYAWVARGSADALLDAARLPFVRGLARIDPRDKLHGAVYNQTAPEYARTPDGQVHFLLLTYPGTSADDLHTQLAAQPALAALELKPSAASVLGPRFAFTAAPEQASQIASADSAAFVEYSLPPMRSRDAVTDLTSNIGPVRDNPPNVNGSGVKVAVREIGKPEAHQDYISRVTFVESDGDATDAPTYTHATAVVGQIASSGVNKPAAKGVAPAVNVLVYSLMDKDPMGQPNQFLTNDLFDASGKGARVSNHSYGPGGLNAFGDYNSVSADWDSALRAADLIAFFAGNEENDGLSPNSHIDFFVGMKNGICMEASTATATASPPNDGSAAFAKFGPMNDGRVKPDLVAFGDTVTLDIGLNGTTTNSGTSFSTPVATGVAALIIQHHKAVFAGAEPSAARLKALLCETATDLGSLGPDNVYGFGIINAAAAVNLIDSGLTPETPLLLNDGDQYQFTLTVPPNMAELKTTLCWMDVPGQPGAAKALVNDLDMELMDPAGNIYYPFSLNPAAPSAPATNTGPNTVDPIEQTVIAAPTPGDWTVTIKGTSIPSGSQFFSFCSNITPTVVLKAKLEASPVSGFAPLNVSFSGQHSQGNIVSYDWDFGDGSPHGSGKTAHHTYQYSAAMPIYTVTLTVTDAAGTMDSATIPIEVDKPVYTVYPLTSTGSVSFSRAANNQLLFTLVAPQFVYQPKKYQDALAKKFFEGKQFKVSVGPIGNLTELNTFTLSKYVVQSTPSESFQITLLNGYIYVRLRQTATRDMLGLFQNGFLIPATDATKPPYYTFVMRVVIESDSAIYQADFNMTYRGNKGTGSLSGKK